MIPEKCHLVGNRRRVLHPRPFQHEPLHQSQVQQRCPLLGRSTPTWQSRRVGPEGPQWESFCPATAELGCDIYLTELTAEALRHITKESEVQTSHTRTPAPSKTSEDTAASESKQIQVLSPEPPSTGEQRLAVLAELLHISPQIPMSNTVTIQEATATHVKGFTLLCLTWAAFDGDGLVIVPSLWIPPEV